MKYLISIDLDWTIILGRNNVSDEIINYLVNFKNNPEVILLINTCRRFYSYKNIINIIPFDYISLECWSFLLNEKWQSVKHYPICFKDIFLTFINKILNKKLMKNLNKWRLMYVVSDNNIDIIGKYKVVSKFSNRFNYFFSYINKSNPISFLQNLYNILSDNIYVFGDEKIDFIWCDDYNTLTFNSSSVVTKYKIWDKTEKWVLYTLQYINDQIWW